MAEEENLVSGIVFCPVCCTNVDVQEPDGAEVSLTCSCGQEWTMEIHEHRLALYGMH